jgi:hypothetical protein
VGVSSSSDTLKSGNVADELAMIIIRQKNRDHVKEEIA